MGSRQRYIRKMIPNSRGHMQGKWRGLSTHIRNAMSRAMPEAECPLARSGYPSSGLHGQTGCGFAVSPSRQCPSAPASSHARPRPLAISENAAYLPRWPSAERQAFPAPGLATLRDFLPNPFGISILRETSASGCGVGIGFARLAFAGLCLPRRSACAHAEETGRQQRKAHGDPHQREHFQPTGES